MDPVQSAMRAILGSKRMSLINGWPILTDELDYRGIDQVFPLFAEQQFFLDELQHEKVKNAQVLEIGVGSGVLSIGAARAGAKRVTALEINPRARNFAGFNFLMNGVEDRVCVIDGNIQQIWQPVQGRQFDYIMSNPPFEPTPPGMNYFYHSAAGPYGLDFIAKIFTELDTHLADGGHAQIVTAAPGDSEAPTLLLDLIKEQLSGFTRVLLNPSTMTFDEIMDRLEGKEMGSREDVDALRRKAKNDGVTHLHLCVLHYEKGRRGIDVGPSRKTYLEYWDVPATKYQEPALAPKG